MESGFCPETAFLFFLESLTLTSRPGNGRNECDLQQLDQVVKIIQVSALSVVGKHDVARRQPV